MLAEIWTSFNLTKVLQCCSVATVLYSETRYLCCDTFLYHVGKMFEDDADKCVECSKDQSAASNLYNILFQVNTDPRCGHKFCGDCLNVIFHDQGKRQFACKRCKNVGKTNMVRSENLSLKSLEETEVDKDIRVRKKIKVIYNETEDCFPDAKSFRDYEEEVEDLIYNLVHDKNVEETKEKIGTYKKKNEKNIVFNQGKKKEADQVIERQINVQNDQLKKKVQDSRIADQQEKSFQREHKRQFNEMMLGERDVVEVTKDNLQAGLANRGNENEETTNLPNTHWSTVARLLQSRELPKVLESKKKVRKGEDNINRTDLVAMHTASGYDHVQWFRKSWEEIVSQTVQPEMKINKMIW